MFLLMRWLINSKFIKLYVCKLSPVQSLFEYCKHPCCELSFRCLSIMPFSVWENLESLYVLVILSLFLVNLNFSTPLIHCPLWSIFLILRNFWIAASSFKALKVQQALSPRNNSNDSSDEFVPRSEYNRLVQQFEELVAAMNKFRSEMWQKVSMLEAKIANQWRLFRLFCYSFHLLNMFFNIPKRTIWRFTIFRWTFTMARVLLVSCISLKCTAWAACNLIIFRRNK